MYGEVYVYEISISPSNNQNALTYNIVFKDMNDPMRLIEGIPFTVNVKDRNKCVTFTSTESTNTSGYLILTMNDTTQLSYTLNCNRTVNNKT